MPRHNERSSTVLILDNLLNHKGSLNSLLDQYRNIQNQSLLKEFCFGTCRYFHLLEFYLSKLMDKPLRSKDRDIHCLLLLGLYQIFYMRIPEHAAINETVKVSKTLNKHWAKGLVNAVLRNAIRQKETLLESARQNRNIAFSHPQWLINAIQQDWPEDYVDILTANNLQAPMTLRVNVSKITRDDYMEKLTRHEIKASCCLIADTGVVLENPINVTELPGFDAGEISVQDEASQLVTRFVDKADHSILDACAAPGGKTCAILEKLDNVVALTAIDNHEKRLSLIKENLVRAGLTAKLVCADAAKPEDWWDGALFDFILLDAPCTGSGVIRRHPDIKLLRTTKDLTHLVKQQKQLLEALWPCLRSGGKLLYTTCSILKQENTEQINQFISSEKSASILPISIPNTNFDRVGVQLLPTPGGQDGFFYALLQKED